MHTPRRSLIPFLLVALAPWIAVRTVQGQEPPPQTTPPQRFFEWTRMPFAKALYEERRERLMTGLGASGGGVFLAPSRHGRSGGETFRQTDDFLYFTGLELPDSILAVDTEHQRSVLFVPDDDARFASPSRPNDFPGRPLGRDPELARVSGLSDVRPVESFETALAGWIRDGRLLRLNPGRGETGLATSFFYDWSAEEKFLHHLRQTHPADAILAAVRPGKSFAELTDVAVASIPEDERKYSQTGLFFGHHVGLDVGDPSFDDAKLLPGMVFTVEPWYYNHDRGIAVFVEDVVLVTAEGHENLSRDLPRSPEGLEKLMQNAP